MGNETSQQCCRCEGQEGPDGKEIPARGPSGVVGLALDAELPDFSKVSPGETAVELAQGQVTVTSAEDQKELKEGQEFKVSLDKAALKASANSSGAHPLQLGIRIDLADGKSLLIEEVLEPGLVQAFNKENPDQALAVLDRIVEVNGKSADSQELAHRCIRDAVLEMKIRRPPPAP
mmetsp:Transcript_16941/g.37215  ORF Transcript_16941/g.37215 Transcript_16941/m.37215 type:complete len:176 (+) Transcript_16941:73-600(+)